MLSDAYVWLVIESPIKESVEESLYRARDNEKISSELLQEENNLKA